MYPSYGNRDPGLGIDPVTVATTGIDIARRIFGGARPRAGGADPCIISFQRGETVRNAGKNGAPPDYRQLPLNLKDDAADCIPIPWGGRMWLIDADPASATYHHWVEVTSMVPSPTGAPPPPAPPPPPEAPNGIGKLLLPAAAAFLLLR